MHEVNTAKITSMCVAHTYTYKCGVQKLIFQCHYLDIHKDESKTLRKHD